MRDQEQGRRPDTPTEAEQIARTNAETLWRVLGLPGEPPLAGYYGPGQETVAESELEKEFGQRRDETRRVGETAEYADSEQLHEMFSFGHPPRRFSEEEGPPVDYQAIQSAVRGLADAEVVTTVYTNLIHRRWWIAENLIRLFDSACVPRHTT